MPDPLSPEVEQLVQQHLDGKEFQSADDVLLAALRLFEQYRSHQRLRADVKEGFDQIERGDAVELGDDRALRAFFDDIKVRGRQRLQTGGSS
jgi:Arc/MetJ-type ribon-helix-helix transcriptional regulator